MTVPDYYLDRKVCIFGMGYVGLTLATVMADVGFDVLGLEIREDVLLSLLAGNPHFFEPGLTERLRKNIEKGSMHFEKNLPADSRTNVYIITVGTPLDAKKKPRMDMVESVSREVSKHLKEGDLVVMRSTVKIGTTQNIVKPILNASGVSYDLAFCPERTLEGQALEELRHLPQIVGGVTPQATVRATQLFQFITSTVVRVRDAETAEMIKLVDNAQRDVQFAYSNEVARMCDAVGISAAEVIRAGKLGYPRTNLPMPGPVGGPCLEKDSHILADGLRELGITPDITVAARSLNERLPDDVVGRFAGILRKIDNFPEHPVISLMGIAFKGRPATDDLRGTMARPIFYALQKYFPHAYFRGYDPVVSQKDIRAFGLEACDTIEKAVKGANLVLILNNHAQFGSMPIETLAGMLARPGFFYDFWNNFVDADLQFPAGTGYIALGSHGIATITPLQEFAFSHATEDPGVLQMETP